MLRRVRHARDRLFRLDGGLVGGSNREINVAAAGVGRTHGAGANGHRLFRDATLALDHRYARRLIEFC
jgi:hypothetical protein